MASNQTTVASSDATAESTSTSVSSSNSTSESENNSTSIFNAVFDILDKITEVEKLFSKGDYSETGSLEELLVKLHQSSDSFDSSNNNETLHLVQYLLTKIETEERILNNSIKHLEITEVSEHLL